MKSDSPCITASVGKKEKRAIYCVQVLSKVRSHCVSHKQLVSALIRCMVLQAWKRWCTQILSALRLVSPFNVKSIWSLQEKNSNEGFVFICGFLSFFMYCSYLHSCDPPIIHGNLTCDTIFIQHNGLIKIGSGIELRRFHPQRVR